jgi:hypothetical protein
LGSKRYHFSITRAQYGGQTRRTRARTPCGLHIFRCPGYDFCTAESVLSSFHVEESLSRRLLGSDSLCTPPLKYYIRFGGSSSQILFILLCAFANTGAYHGTGQHAADIKPPSEIPIALHWWWACEPTYVLSNMAIKASLAIMLLRLAVDRTHRIIIWITIIVTELFSAAFFFVFIFQCTPSSYFWTQYTGAKGSCINPMVIVYSTYVYSALICVGDWTLAIVPYFIVRNLQMRPRAKVLVAVILAMGAIASTATIIRIPYLHTLSNKADFLYATTDVAIWTCCETGLAITATSAATLRPLFQSFIARSANTLARTASNARSRSRSQPRARPKISRPLCLWPRPSICAPRAVHLQHWRPRSIGNSPQFKDLERGRPVPDWCDPMDKQPSTDETIEVVLEEEIARDRLLRQDTGSVDDEIKPLKIRPKNHICSMMRRQ